MDTRNLVGQQKLLFAMLSVHAQVVSYLLGRKNIYQIELLETLITVRSNILA